MTNPKGLIVGHTKSGKPVRCPYRAENVQDFDWEDHFDAMLIFSNIVGTIYRDNSPNWQAQASYYGAQEAEHRKLLHELQDEIFAFLNAS